MMLLLRYVAGSGKPSSFDPFMSGLVAGYLVFGRGEQGGVNQQIVIYIFARVVLALAKLLVLPSSDTGSARRPLLTNETKDTIRANAWPVFASVSWAAVMYIFNSYPETLQPSLRSSMQYMYVMVVIVITMATRSLQPKKQTSYLVAHASIRSSYTDDARFFL